LSQAAAGHAEGRQSALNPRARAADDKATMTWLLVALVLAAAVAVMIGILAEGTNARTRARGR